MTILKVLAGETVWPPPIWLMRQAGRYLPEYREIRASVHSFLDLCLDPEKAAAVTLQPLQRFGFDAAILFSDILVLPWALGWDLAFVEGEGPKLRKWNGPKDTATLVAATAKVKYDPVLKTVERVRARLSTSQCLIGFAGAPFTVATYLIEGGGSTDHNRTREVAFSRFQDFLALVEVLVESTATYLIDQAKAGAQALMLFDSWAGCLPSALFESLVIAPTEQVVRNVRAACPDIPIIGFPRLAGAMLERYSARASVDAVGVDTATDLSFADAIVGNTKILQGNLDPAALSAGGPALISSIDTILRVARRRPVIFNLGHGIWPTTPVENVACLVEYIRNAR